MRARARTLSAATPQPLEQPEPVIDGAALAARVARYDRRVDHERIRRAYQIASRAHSGQTRYSGEAYITHPTRVAEILTTLRMDADTIITALLHDTVEDTDVTLDTLAHEFGDHVAQLVDGVTKLSKLSQVGRRARDAEKSKQAENLQKFVLAMSKDVRVLLVKLADRLHNMRTLHHVPKPHKRERIALETLEIYAPLARRVGVHRICGELEDLSFRHLNPAAYESVTRRLRAARAARADAVAEVSGLVVETLQDHGIDASVFGREKKAYSIWRKLQRRGLDFEDLADIYAFRVIVPTIDDCYRALGLIHRAWRCVPERFKDYISTPKPNNYRSLHTTVLGPDHRRVELQIRTAEMDRIAEDGVAAHWCYKNNIYGYDAEAARDAGGDPLARLAPLVEILEHGGEPEEFLEHAKLEMFTDQVFAFTPKGRVVPLPQGATPLDFAYAVHTDVGATCVGARINGRARPLRTPLENGDVVEIIRSATPAPVPGWEEIAITGRARSAIRRLIRKSNREEYARIGKAIAEHAFRREGLDLAAAKLEDALKRLELPDETALFSELGMGGLSAAQLLNAVFPGRLAEGEEPTHRELMADEHAQLYVRGVGLTPGLELHFAPCCAPLPGDRIVGIRMPERGVEIHAIDCDRLAAFEDEQERWLDLGWTPAAQQAVALGRIEATVQNEPGALAEISGAVGRSRGNIAGVSVSRRAPDFYDMVFDVEVENARHLTHILAAMRACSTVVAAQRLRDAVDAAVA